jgi:hypothetical protein
MKLARLAGAKIPELAVNGIAERWIAVAKVWILRVYAFRPGGARAGNLQI